MLIGVFSLADKRKYVINPYYFTIENLFRRMVWDFRPESRRSRKILYRWKDKFLGEKAVILCNGPSLLKSDLSLLKGVFTFGLNKINLLFDTSEFRPSCIVSINQYVIQQNASFYNETDIPLFLDSCGANLIKHRLNVAFLHSTGIRKFAKDCSMSIYQGYTVTFVALELAFHMGFSKVALIGCDHNFATSGPANKLVLAQNIDENHFDKNYFTGGEPWQLPDLLESEISYIMAKKAYGEHERKVYNATEGGRLEIFERCSLEEFIGSV